MDACLFMLSCVFSRVAIQSIERKRVFLQTCCRCVEHLLVCLSVRRVYCGKTVDWTWMPFGVVSRVGRGMDVLDGWGGDRRR